MTQTAHDHQHHQDHHLHTPADESLREYLKFALVLATIVVLTVASTEAFSAPALMRWFMGWFFVVFATFKLINIRVFAAMFGGYDLIAARARWYGFLYPFIELALGLAFMANIFPLAVNAVTLAVMSVGAAGVARELGNPEKIKCACLGNVIKLPLTTVSLSEDVLMGAMAVVMLVGAI